VALPYPGYRISYTLSYPESSFLAGQFHSVVVNEENFKNEIASCRTFSLYKEISILMDKGLIKGGSLDNAVVIKDDVIFSKGGLFFPNEMARHKILDLIGDLSLIGFDFHAHIIAIRSGHASNFAFAQQLLNHITTENH
jgi:UDP-3-O-[3-hydroxymyristoyl] N-acetylglucosamine deacetylase